MKTKKFPRHFLIATGLISALLSAESVWATTEDTATSMDTVVVTATRTESAVENTSAAVEVITQKNIEAKGCRNTIT